MFYYHLKFHYYFLILIIVVVVQSLTGHLDRLSGQAIKIKGNTLWLASAFNAGDPSSIPGSGRSAGEGIGYPLQYSWASLMAQMVKNLPAIWETWV